MFASFRFAVNVKRFFFREKNTFGIKGFRLMFVAAHILSHEKCKQESRGEMFRKSQFSPEVWLD